MSAGDCDESPARYRAPQSFCPSRDWDSERARAGELGMILGHRRCNDQLAGSGDMIRAVTLEDPDAKALEIFGSTWIHIASAYDYATTRQQLGERAHPRARYPNEVNRAGIGRAQARVCSRATS
jgi:hypothetical protein